MFLSFHMLSVYNKRLELGGEKGKIRNSGIPMIVAEIKGLMSERKCVHVMNFKVFEIILKIPLGNSF